MVLIVLLPLQSVVALSSWQLIESVLLMVCRYLVVLGTRHMLKLSRGTSMLPPKATQLTAFLPSVIRCTYYMRGVVLVEALAGEGLTMSGRVWGHNLWASGAILKRLVLSLLVTVRVMIVARLRVEQQVMRMPLLVVGIVVGLLLIVNRLLVVVRPACHCSSVIFVC